MGLSPRDWLLREIQVNPVLRQRVTGEKKMYFPFAEFLLKKKHCNYVSKRTRRICKRMFEPDLIGYRENQEELTVVAIEAKAKGGDIVKGIGQAITSLDFVNESWLVIHFDDYYRTNDEIWSKWIEHIREFTERNGIGLALMKQGRGGWGWNWNVHEVIHEPKRFDKPPLFLQQWGFESN